MNNDVVTIESNEFTTYKNPNRVKLSSDIEVAGNRLMFVDVEENDFLDFTIDVKAVIQENPDKAVYYVFETSNGIYCEDTGEILSLFRVEHYKEENAAEVLLSTPGYLSIKEGVTFLFKDINTLLKECETQVLTSFFTNDITEDYIAYKNSNYDDEDDFYLYQ